jgi:hypothetical protein
MEARNKTNQPHRLLLLLLLVLPGVHCSEHHVALQGDYTAAQAAHSADTD